MSDAPDCCPLCQANQNMLETLSVGFYCNVCAQCFERNAEGRIVRWQRTNHEPKRKTDVSGTVIDDD